MTSKRNTSRHDDAVLDAARDCVLAVGVRRTTLTDVARRAGVSRMTLYRRWPDVRGLVGDLMTREWLAVTVGSVPRPGPLGSADVPLVDALVGGLRALRAHPLLRKILDVDPELMLPYLFDRRGASQNRLLELIEEALRRGHADGSVREDHPVRQARALVLVLQSFALSLQTMTDDTDPELDDTAFYAEVRRILERILAP
ncbi:TetR/AcrR family transcriptional regulator [Streptomyces sp. NA02950]|uniref:TetR/AcrR family transcriptional regulator n=1 Tax=Streptomyces sp. NA02950 TaxID=2742137 RepID=UPI001590618A|nr:TetR/AcrR family transcriptional regulator [Streptomyces sp. NA02950]QKV96338.1 TetR/AcrR family transcriptional regulator [Streptomyces sp. NA02950]